MNYTRGYVQFNNLVFADMVKDADGSVSFKGDSQAYSYGHGAYRPFKSEYNYADAQSVSMTIILSMKRLPCEYRPFYPRFVRSELSRPGKLWAVEGNELLWTNAVATSISTNMSSRKDELELDIDFELYDGVWRKANRQNTFLIPYDICSIFDCKEYLTVQPCPPLDTDFNCCTDCPTDSCGEGEGVTQDSDGYLVIDPDTCDSCVSRDNSGFIVLSECVSTEEPKKENCECCCADEIDKSMALCYHLEDLQEYYTCYAPYLIVYDCEKGAELFGNIGDKLCEKACSGIIAGRIYSETDIPTTEVDIVLTGRMIDPIIEINGNTNIIKGEYDGTLTISRTGDVYYAGKKDCCNTLLAPSVWSVPTGNNYGFTVNPQWNRVIINTNACCGSTCAYIKHNALTY